MTTTGLSRIKYLFEKQSDLWIARETGIPRATIGFVRRGERKLPGKYTLNLRRVYQRETYRRLWQAGVPWREARRFQWYSPERVRLITAEATMVVNTMAQGASESVAWKLRKEGKPVNMDSIWAEMKEKVKKGLFKSKKSIEDIGQYET
ncbi:MAG: hypothetical protein FVQ79_11635 [Planctomycetes bacterium]|nr:hypothetical protein [Planctomycetota bacterium]